MTQPTTQDILSSMRAPALVCSPSGVIEAMNASAADWLATSNSTAAGQAISDLLYAPSEGLEGFILRSERLGHAFCEGQVYRQGRHSRRTGMLCHAQRFNVPELSGSLLLIFTDDIPTAATNGHNVACKDACNSSFDANADALSFSTCADENETNALSAVALGLVHEVNQPLTAIAAYAHSCSHWLQAGQNDHPKLRPTVDKIIEQVHVTGQMVNSLKGLVRGHDDERRTCDLNQLVRESLDLLALDPRIEHCSVDSQLETYPCPVVVSSVQIKIVLLNLLRNALEASLASEFGESRIYVSVTSEKKNWASATVSDTGVGITAEAGEQLFQPFVTSKTNGLGLGLVISRCLANAHAGCIDYQPGVPHGASFELRLPLAR